MFARTDRLLLRPGFAEDAPALARTIGDEMIVRNLSTVPWPYGEAEAEKFLSHPADRTLPTMLMVERTDGAPRLVGACGLSRRPSGAVELGYWVARGDWNRGFATEAARALIDIARTLRLPRLEAWVFDGNAASERVLVKLGFHATGLSAPRFSCARGVDTTARMFRLGLAERSEAAPLAA